MTRTFGNFIEIPFFILPYVLAFLTMASGMILSAFEWHLPILPIQIKIKTHSFTLAKMKIEKDPTSNF